MKRLSLIYLVQGQYDQAITDYNKAIEINPRYAEAYNNRGGTYSQIGQYDQAISDCTKAIEINPRYADAYNNRGNAYRCKGEYDKAWADVYKMRSLGYQANPEFLKALREASGRQE
jgi:tetratricopeptide (TPR) repeat protein